MIDIITDNATLDDELAAIIRSVAEYTLNHQKASGDINIAIVDDEGIRRMNRDFRETDDVTDVLSFPALEGTTEFFNRDVFLGDIAIDIYRAREQASAFNHSIGRELAFLTVHGILHLLGYDHETYEDEADMFALQDAILSEMKIER